jgi:hypothetical protein
VASAVTFLSTTWRGSISPQSEGIAYAAKD